MKILNITVQGNVATYRARDGYIVCGNDEAYKIQFALDSDWAALDGIKVHFIWNGQHFDRDMQEGFTCEVPQLINTEEVEVGLFTATKRTTTGAKIPCKRSILCRSTTPSVENERNYASEAQEAAARAEEAAKLAASYVPGDKKEMKDEIIDSIITQEAGGSESLVMSQKAVTDMVNDALGVGGTTEYETVNSTDEMTDKSKQYVLSTTGTIWTYGEFTKEPPELYDTEAAELKARHGSGSNGIAGHDRYIATGYIPVDMSVDKPRLEIETSMSMWTDKNPCLYKVGYYDLSQKCIGSKVLATAMGGSNVECKQENGIVTVYIGLCNGAKESYYNSIAFVRFDFLAADTGGIVTESQKSLIKSIKNPDDNIGEDWHDTKVSPETANDVNYVDLLVKVDQNKTSIAEVSNRVTALETGSETITIPSFWKAAVDACIYKIKTLQVGRNCVTFPFFSDNHQRNGYAGMLIAYIMKECNIPYCFYGGDSIDNGYIASESVMIAQDKAFDTAMSYIPNGRFCRAVGNHDGYWNVSKETGDEYYYTDAQIYELFLREESIAQNKHFGGEGTYYYVDDIASQVRWIVLDTNDREVEQAQIDWLQNTALSFNESGWAVVFISHQPISNHYHANIDNAEDVREVVENYINGSSANKADVVGWFSGHIHRDRIYTNAEVKDQDGNITSVPMLFTQVTITSDHTGIAPDDEETKHPVANDDESHAIDFVTINKNTKKVNLTRLGIGANRDYSYGATEQ